MTQSRAPQLADAIVAELVDASQPWNVGGILAAKRSWLPVRRDGDLRTLRCAVVPLTLENEKLDRRPRHKEDYGAGIHLIKSVGLDASGDVITPQADALDLIAEQIYDWFGDAHFLSAPSLDAGQKVWRVMDRQRQDLYDLGTLYTEHAWETLIVLTIRGTI